MISILSCFLYSIAFHSLFKYISCFTLGTTIHIIICDYDGNQMQCFEAGETPAIRLSNLTCFTWEDTDEVGLVTFLLLLLLILNNRAN